MKYKARDRVEIKGNNGKWYKATVYNASEYREPDMAYAVDVDGITGTEPIFCGEQYLRPLVEVGNEKE